MNKRQMKKKQKKEMILAFQAVLGACLASEDPMATLNKIRSEGEQYFKKMGLNTPPEGFDDCMNQCEEIIKELCLNQ